MVEGLGNALRRLFLSWVLVALTVSGPALAAYTHADGAIANFREFRKPDVVFSVPVNIKDVANKFAGKTYLNCSWFNAKGYWEAGEKTLLPAWKGYRGVVKIGLSLADPYGRKKFDKDPADIKKWSCEILLGGATTLPPAGCDDAQWYRCGKPGATYNPKVERPFFARALPILEKELTPLSFTGRKPKDKLIEIPDGNGLKFTGADKPDDEGLQARHGIKPKLVCGRFPERFLKPCHREILKYYAIRDAEQAVKAAGGDNPRPECRSVCDVLRGLWELTDWTRRTALETIVLTRDEALKINRSRERKAEIRSWYEQAKALWAEDNKTVNGCTRSEAEAADAYCRSICSAKAKGTTRNLSNCSLTPFSVVEHAHWLRNLYPPGSAQLMALEKAGQLKELDPLVKRRLEMLRRVLQAPASGMRP